eukprot:8062522-Pyramimonas_sp.AAC.1
MCADPMTKGSTSRDLFLSVMDGKRRYDRLAAKLSEKKWKKTVPRSQHNNLANKGRNDAAG